MSDKPDIPTWLYIVLMCSAILGVIGGLLLMRYG